MKNIAKHIMGILALCFFAASCSKMDHTYKELIKDGETKYLGISDSVKAFSGRNRVLLTWILPSDPDIAKTKVYWNNKKDSVVLNYPSLIMEKNISLPIDNLAEGLYSFEIYNSDNKGHSSIKSTVSTRAYGEEYLSSLYQRPIKTAESFFADAKVVWAGANSESFGSEVKYVDINGIERVIFVPPNEEVTILPGVKMDESFTFRSIYMPDKMSIDKFYTPYETMKVKGVLRDISKAGWTITASSEDIATQRPAVNLIDDDPKTVWVNKIATGINYPHTLIVDMKQTVSIKENEGFTFTQRETLAGAVKLLEIQISINGTTWESLKDYTLLSVVGIQQVPTKVVRSFRYFKIILKSDYAGTVNAPLAEIGVFRLQ